MCTRAGPVSVLRLTGCSFEFKIAEDNGIPLHLSERNI